MSKSRAFGVVARRFLNGRRLLRDDVWTRARDGAPVTVGQSRGIVTTDTNGLALRLDGSAAAGEIRAAVTEDIRNIREQRPQFLPGLAIVQVGHREDSNVYIRMKMKMAKECGIYTQHVRMPRSTTQRDLLASLEGLNSDPSVHGIILQLPPESDQALDVAEATNVIDPGKDVDGLTNENAGKLARGDLDCIIPCTPLGCLDLIKRTGIQIQGSNAVVIGRSKIVGSPMADLLTWNHSTVTKCHSKTKNLEKICREADILVAAVGSPEMVKGPWIKPGSVVIDCGINSVPDSSRPSGLRLVGDVDQSQAKAVAGFLTPVPGGVGPMTVALLLKNTFDNAKKICGIES